MIGIPKVSEVSKAQKRNMIGLMKSNFETLPR